MKQSLTVLGRDGAPVETSWEVDLAAACRAQGWATRQPGLLGEEVAEMALYFPRWVLTPASGNEVARCGRCYELVVFRDGAARCASCGAPRGEEQLAWVGHLPVAVGGLARALRRIRAKPDPAYPLVEAGGAPIWLVPVTAYYPANWPQTQPTLKYDKRLFSILGIDSPSAVHHVVQGNVMCLYGGEPWRQVTMRMVLQQRVVNHLASMLKIGNGQRPSEAFAGRQHIYDYQYER